MEKETMWKTLDQVEEGTHYEVYRDIQGNIFNYEDGDTNEMLVADLLNQIYNGKIDEDYVEFTFNDSVIKNPYYDESGRFDVNPIEYYGEAYLNALK